MPTNTTQCILLPSSCTQPSIVVFTEHCVVLIDRVVFQSLSLSLSRTVCVPQSRQSMFYGCCCCCCWNFSAQLPLTRLLWCWRCLFDSSRPLLLSLPLRRATHLSSRVESCCGSALLSVSALMMLMSLSLSLIELVWYDNLSLANSGQTAVSAAAAAVAVFANCGIGGSSRPQFGLQPEV